MRAMLAFLLVVAGCSTASPSPTAISSPTPTPAPTWSFRPGLTPAPAETRFGVYIPPSSIPPQELSLEVDGQAWSIFVVAEGGHGVTSRVLSETSSVRLVGVADCRVYATFEANPGRAYGIRFEEDGSVSVEEPGGLEDGPSMGERDPTDCE